MNLEDLRKALEQAGLGRVAQKICELTQPRLKIGTTPTDEGRLWLGTTKLGGHPDLPASLAWPTRAGIPMAFLGQLNLAELQAYPCCGLLPPSGMLWFFYDVEHGAWGFNPDDKESWRVLFHEEPHAELARHTPPANLPEGSVFKVCSLSFVESESIPGWESLPITELELTETETQAYAEFVGQLFGSEESEPGHQLLGHPRDIQGEMQIECQLVSHGISFGDGSWVDHPRRAELEPGARDWQLLLQIGSDEHAEMMWGDLGMLYFWIHDRDLAKRNFNDVWMILQCF